MSKASKSARAKARAAIASILRTIWRLKRQYEQAESPHEQKAAESALADQRAALRQALETIHPRVKGGK